jgi:hypothetical protein
MTFITGSYMDIRSVAMGVFYHHLELYLQSDIASFSKFKKELG